MKKIVDEGSPLSATNTKLYKKVIFLMSFAC